jgi:hypothetical protein
MPRVVGGLGGGSFLLHRLDNVVAHDSLSLTKKHKKSR